MLLLHGTILFIMFLFIDNACLYPVESAILHAVYSIVFIYCNAVTFVIGLYMCVAIVQVVI